MLCYTADMKNPLSLSRAEKRARVDGAIEALALDSCRHVKIGDALHRGISGPVLALTLCAG